MAEESDLLQLNEDEQLAYAIFLSNEAVETNNTTEETESQTVLQEIEPPPTYEEAVQNQNENDFPPSPPNEFLNEDEQLAYAIWLSVNGDGVESSQTQVVYESPNSDKTSESDSDNSEENSDLNHSSRNVYIENAVIRRDAEADEARQRRRLENLRRRRNEWANANIGSADDKPEDDKRDPSPSKNKNDKKNSVNVGHANALKGICYAIKRCRLMGVNAANANAVGAVAGASADARGLNVNVANANAVGASATASANATGVNVNAGNVSARGVSASATASVTGVDVAAGNVSATAVDLSAGVHATGARAAVGNVSVTGTGAGAHLNVEGTGIKAFNVNVGGPKAKVCVNVSGPSVSFGNIDIGLTPTLNLGLNLGLDLGIPFLGSGNSGGGGGGGGSGGSGAGANSNNTNENGTGQQGNSGDNNGGNDGGANGGGGDGGGNNPGGNNGGANDGVGGLRDYIANLEERFPNRGYLYNIHGERVFRTDYKPDGKVFEYEKNNDKKPVDFERDKNIPKCDCEDHTSTPNENGDKFVGFRGMGSERNAQLEGAVPPTANNNSSWGGGKYTTEDPNTAAAYTRANDLSVQPINRAYTSADTPIYYTRTPLDRPEAEVMLNEVSRVTDGQFTFGGPQGSSDELRSSEFITKPLENFRTEPSLHQSDGYELKMYHEGEINAERIIPDEYVSMPNRVQEQPYQNGYEYENIIDEAKKKKKEEESSDEEIDTKPNCNHAKNVMCFNCMNKGSGAKITKLSKDSEKKIYGFKND